jgi:hypothetical protein
MQGISLLAQDLLLLKKDSVPWSEHASEQGR